MKNASESSLAVKEVALPATKKHVTEAQNWKEDADDAKEAINAQTLNEIDQAIARCRELYSDPLMSERTQHEYEKMLNELRADGEVEKVRENIGYLMATLNKAERYKHSFGSMLHNATEKGWISSESEAKWWNRFHDPSVVEWTRKEWVEKEFPKLLANWQAVAEKRDDVLKLAEKRGLTGKDIPELGILLSKDLFLSRNYFMRKDLTSRVKALILAHDKNKKPFLTFIRKELEGWADEGIMHRSKVGEWMERVMESDNPEAFASKVLYPFKKNWEAVRQDFDRLNSAMDVEGIPRGFRPVQPDKFLLMNYKQRTSYVSLAWIRLEGAAEEDKKLAAYKLKIRHNLDTEDFEGAEKDLAVAFSIKADDRELLSMQEYIASHKPEKEEDENEEESPNPQKLADEMRQCLDTITDPKLWSVYVKALSSGPAVFNRLSQVMGNRVWLHEVANWDEAEEQKRLAYLRSTKQQEKGILLDMELMGEEGVLSEISSHADSGGGKTPPNLSADEYWGYWATFIPSIPYSQHQSIVKNVNWRLKKNLRELNRLGFSFSSHGPLQSLN